MPIIILNQSAVNAKLAKLKADGLSKLHIVSDFDRTLTRCFVDGKKIPSVYALVRKGNYLGDEYSKAAYALFDKYHPYEVDASLDLETKKQKMHEWWHEHHEVFKKTRMTREIIAQMVTDFPKIFRDQALALIKLSHSHQIPFLIFSAGLGDVIEEYLRREDALFENMYVISNFFVFDEQGVVTGYQEEFIHVFNKNEIAAKHKPYLDKLTNRKNVILLGDSLGDIHMADGITHDTVLKIGFYNEDNHDKQAYLDAYDILITEDASMEYVVELIKSIS